MDAGHYLYLLLNSFDSPDNLLFRSPIKRPSHILDIGTGPGTWAIDAADKFPEATVFGVDLYPPPASFVPPNCFLEVDDVNEDWTWKHKFDLIHGRLLLGAFADEQWQQLYARCFENLKPGGWIEQVELDVRVMSDDGTLAEDSLLAGWGQTFLDCADRAGRSLNTQEEMKSRIEQAGFVNIQDHLFKCPIGNWPKNKVLKEAGRINFHHWTSGLDGWSMFLLTKFGAPKPWTADEVRVYVAKVRQELQDRKLHIYHLTRRVWAQKPYDA
ncbi:S-adenosyl-L-methionine-dependent methyltransferase [Teratosphaeria nubilosa]|uniref:S-adenosyl-L-methionine-dependent methyltransferase n=1 Tax=Teratosphaeria nubilosa TaxID=161662 RepID=A0A6G1L1P3_9PEZI|nr:S-adenosyl-L-methionine-dependent methyltransferase [Teratosphaeria nubilosa]